MAGHVQVVNFPTCSLRLAAELAVEHRAQRDGERTECYRYRVVPPFLNCQEFLKIHIVRTEEVGLDANLTLIRFQI